MSDLPYAVEAQVSLSETELQLLRDAYNAELPSPRLQVQNLIYLLSEYMQEIHYRGTVRAHDKLDQEEGVKLLHEIYLESPSRRRECLYYLALGNYKLGKYREAKRLNETLLKLEESNPQALSLRQLIHDKVQTEGLVGMGIVGGVILVGSLVVSALFKKK